MTVVVVVVVVMAGRWSCLGAVGEAEVLAERAAPLSPRRTPAPTDGTSFDPSSPQPANLGPEAFDVEQQAAVTHKLVGPRARVG